MRAGMTAFDGVSEFLLSLQNGISIPPNTRARCDERAKCRWFGEKCMQNCQPGDRMAEYRLIRFVYRNCRSDLRLDFGFNHLEEVINAPNVIRRETCPVRRTMARGDGQCKVMEAEPIHRHSNVCQSDWRSISRFARRVAAHHIHVFKAAVTNGHYHRREPGV